MHTTEPWTTAGIDIEAGGEYIADFSCPELTAEAEAANVARACECVNACAGIEDPVAALEKVRAILDHIATYAPSGNAADARRALALLTPKAR